MMGMLLDKIIGGDLVVVNGEVAIGDIDSQNAAIIILANKGEIKEQPTKGVGAEGFVEGQSVNSLIREINKEFFKEGLHGSNFKAVAGKLNFEVKY